ncbi:hypothetical protein B0I35DRAFT_44822 [Stachybotrys elegans]|uniref:Uncharacterized protein n=1 Tax=Stachybotrys elegans TaxID=80388 RepID=A0A8K0T924_9HYPO|nr:hypothetical protein B0I35DRAFT_44822 [Stachybotrys elegans]
MTSAIAFPRSNLTVDRYKPDSCGLLIRLSCGLQTFCLGPFCRPCRAGRSGRERDRPQLAQLAKQLPPRAITSFIHSISDARPLSAGHHAISHRGSKLSRRLRHGKPPETREAPRTAWEPSSGFHSTYPQDSLLSSSHGSRVAKIIRRTQTWFLADSILGVEITCSHMI